MILYLQLSLSKMSSFCWLTCLFLSNSGSQTFFIVITDCVRFFPVKVLNDLVAMSSFGWRPFGKDERLTKVLLDPESSNTLRSLQLRINPIIPAIKIVAGNLFFSKFSDCLLLLSVSDVNDSSLSATLLLMSAVGWDGVGRLTLTLSLLNVLLWSLVQDCLPKLEPKLKLSALTLTVDVNCFLQRSSHFLQRLSSLLLWSL